MPRPYPFGPPPPPPIPASITAPDPDSFLAGFQAALDAVKAQHDADESKAK